jgi:predicted GNAT family N-acyltransferase
MIFAEIRHGSKEYRQECALRHEILRAPLGLNLYDEDLDTENSQHHFGLFLENGTLVACAIAVPVSAEETKIRQMAVREDFQGQGCGRAIMSQLIEHFAPAGPRRFSLNARASITGFYEALGFAVVGEAFMEVGIPHRKMVKSV